MSKKLKVQTSPFFTNKVLMIIYSVILVFVFFSVYSKIFDKKVDLNGDNASYYVLGKAIAGGHGYTSIYDAREKPHTFYPPGYPFVLAVSQKIFSDKIVTLKRVNGFLFILSILLFMQIVYKLTDNIHLAFITNLMLLTNAVLLRFSTIMMSEIPFMFASLLVLYFLIGIDYNKPIWKSWRFILLIIFLASTYYIKSIAIALILAVLLFFILKKYWKHLVSLVIGVGLLRLPWIIRSSKYGGGSYINQLLSKNPYRPELGKATLLDLVERVFVNLERYITREIPVGVFNFNQINYQEAVSSNEWFLGVLFIIPIIFGLFHIKKHVSLFVLYFLGYFGVLMLWPQVWFGSRFLLPLIPLLAFLFLNGIYNFIELISQKIFRSKNSKVSLIIFVIISLFYIKSNSTEAINGIIAQAKRKQPNNFANFFKLGTWVKNNTKENSITISRKVQLFYLYSHKYGAKYKYTLDVDEQIEYLKSLNADYVVLEQLGFSSTARYLYPAIQKYPNKFKLVKHLKNPDTYLFKFEPNK